MEHMSNDADLRRQQTDSLAKAGAIKSMQRAGETRAEALKSLVPLQQYRAERPNVFCSDESLRWFCRQHGSELVKGGALVLLGRRKLAEPARFDAVAFEIGQRLAAVRVGR